MLGGVILFNISDAILAFTLFIKDFPKRDFYIMLSYILAQGFFNFRYFKFFIDLVLTKILEFIFINDIIQERM